MDVGISILISLIAGILTGLITGFMTFYLIRFRKPKVEISNSIARYKTDGETFYCIKIINKSRCYLYNLHYELCLVNAIQWKNHKGDYDYIYDKTVLTFHKQMWNVMCPFSKKNTDYALRVSTKEDLEGLLERDRGAFLTFTFTAYHGVSDSCKVFEQRYGCNQIQNGRFVCGQSFDICEQYRQKERDKQ